MNYPAITLIERVTEQTLSEPVREALDGALAYWYAGEECYAEDTSLRDTFVEAMYNIEEGV